MHLERIQISLIAAKHGDAHLHVALTAVLVVVGNKGRRHRLENRRLLADRRCISGFGRLALSAVHEVPGRPHGRANGQQQRQHDHNDQLEFAFGCGVFHCCCFALRHANNPSLIGFSQSHGKARASVMPEVSAVAQTTLKSKAPSPQPSPGGRGSRPRCQTPNIDLKDRVDYGFTTAVSGRRTSQASPNRSPLPLGEG
ncbi:hypothetical protein D3C87_934520 [compost metagenome]